MIQVILLTALLCAVVLQSMRQTETLFRGPAFQPITKRSRNRQ